MMVLCLYSRPVTERRLVRLVGYEGIGSDEILVRPKTEEEMVLSEFIIYTPFFSHRMELKETRKRKSCIRIVHYMVPNKQYKVRANQGFGLCSTPQLSQVQAVNRHDHK